MWAFTLSKKGSLRRTKEEEFFRFYHKFSCRCRSRIVRKGAGLLVPEFTVTHLLPYLLTIPLCGQWNVQWLKREYWLCFGVGYYSTWLWIRISILSCWVIPQDLCSSLTFSLPIGGEITWQSFFESLYSFNWGMRLKKCRPSGLLAQEHSDWFKPPRHMLTSLVVYGSIKSSQNQ